MTKTLEELQKDVERMEFLVYGIPTFVIFILTIIGLGVVMSKVFGA